MYGKTLCTDLRGRQCRGNSRVIACLYLNRKYVIQGGMGLILVKGGNVHFPKGETKKADILIDGDKILKTASDIQAEAEVIDASGCEVFPGFILPATSVGLYNYADLRYTDSDEKSSPVNADLHVRYALDPVEVRMQGYEKHGITAFGAVPNESALVAGQTGVYHTAGRSAADMAISETVALKVNFLPGVKRTFAARHMRPMTRMGMTALLREEFQKAVRLGSGDQEYNPSGEVFRKVLNRELPLLCSVREHFDIEILLDLQKEFGFRMILLGAYQADRCAGRIREAGASVLLGDLLDCSFVTYYDSDIPALLAMSEDIPMAFSNNSSGYEGLLWSAEKAVRNGLDAEKAIDMLTIKTAEILGVADKTGSVEAGKYADISIWSGHPLKSYAAQIQVCITAGKVWRAQS